MPSINYIGGIVKNPIVTNVFSISDSLAQPIPFTSSFIISEVGENLVMEVGGEKMITEAP